VKAPDGGRENRIGEGETMGAWKHLRAVALLPGIVLVVIPAVILWLTGPDTLGLWRSVPASKAILQALGGVCVGLGLVLIVGTARLFGTIGRGTLAPWDPPKRLVVRGVYRYVRNPMMSGALLTLLGEALLSACLPLLCWLAVAGVVYAVYIPLSEEPGLARRFGDDYMEYKKNVPRWVPRRKPWQLDDLQRKVGQP
jgi:protein-S-isoprenylcysteine O-methyltransferase Ste14